MGDKASSQQADPASWNVIEEVSRRFEAAWKSGQPPDILGCIEVSAAAGSATTRRELLTELVMLDVEYRWRSAAGRVAIQNPGLASASPIRLADYVARYPEFGPLERLPDDLVAEEYRARQLWGDQPSREEYLREFGSSRPGLVEALVETEREMATRRDAAATLGGFLALSNSASPKVPLSAEDAQKDSEPLRDGSPKPEPPVKRGPSLEQFLERLTDSGLMEAAEVREVLAGLPDERKPKTAEAIAREMFHQGKLTRFQAQAIYQGKTRGLVVGNYVVLDRIGQGGMGQVYKAYHRKMKRTVALKMLPSSATKSPDAVKRFQREVEAAAKLLHPNIVTAHDADESHEMHFLVMEYVDGRDLAAVVRERGPFAVAAAVDCVLQAARGLEYAHAKNVFHRDIKPSNLLRDSSGAVKILDMGLARIDQTVGSKEPADEQSLTRSGQVMGTLDFMAPEQALDVHTADARADIYSLGCTLYYLITGRTPYSGDTVTKKILAHREAPIPSLRTVRDEIPPELDALCQRMLAKRPGDRPQTAHEVVVELERWQATFRGAALVTDFSTPSTGLARVAEAHCSATDPVDDTPSSAFTETADLSTPVPAVQATTIRGPRLVIQRLAGRLVAWLKRRSRRDLLIAVGAAALFALIAFGIVLSIHTSEGTLIVEVSEPDAVVEILNDRGEVLIHRNAGQESLTIAVAPGTRRLRVSKPGFEFFTKDVEIHRGENEVIRAKLVAKLPDVNPTGPVPPLAVAPFDAKKAREHQEAWAKYLGLPVEMTNSIGMRFVLVPPGEFEMGSTVEQVAEALQQTTEHAEPVWRESIPGECPQRHVVLNRAFYLGTFEVTVGQFRQFANEQNYRTELERKGRGGMRVENVRKGRWVMGSAVGASWQNVGFNQLETSPVVNLTIQDMTAFADWLTRKEGRPYRFPTPSEWEYACRAGTTTRYNTGDAPSSLQGFANIADATAREKLNPNLKWAQPWHDGFAYTSPVGTFKPNAFGLYDMHGNALELCGERVSNGTSPSSSDSGAVSSAQPEMHYSGRGGAWWFGASVCRSAYRQEFQSSEIGDVTSGSDSGGKASPMGGMRLVCGINVPRSLNVDRGTERHTPDRLAAEWVLEKGGKVTIHAAGFAPTLIVSRDSLPPADFRLEEVDLRDCNILDADLSHLSGLTNLTKLWLNGPGVTDAALKTLAQFSGLEYLELFGTKITNEGLDNLLPLQHLSGLALGFTRISGDGIRRLQGLSHLKDLSLNGSQITDDGLPEVVKLRQLENLDLRGLPGVTDKGMNLLSDLPNLTSLLITPGNDAELTHLQALKHLGRLVLCRGSVSDRGVAELAKLQTLTLLVLEYGVAISPENVLTLRKSLPKCNVVEERSSPAKRTPTGGPVSTDAQSRDREAAQWVLNKGGKVTIHVAGSTPKSIASRDSLPPGDFRLIEIDLQDCGILDSDLPRIGKLTHLTRLSVNGPGVSDVGLKTIAQFTSLNALGLFGTRITDAGLDQLSPLTSLTELCLAFTDITDDGMPRLQGFPKLTSLAMNGSQITDKGLSHLARFKQLESLDLRSLPKVTDEGAKSVGELVNLKWLLLAPNITDEGLSHLTGLTKLSQLVSEGRITDRAIPYLERMKSLGWLVLDGDQPALTQAGMARLKKALPKCRIEYPFFPSDADKSLTRGKKVAATCVWQNAAKYDGAKAIDGDPMTVWRADLCGQAALEVDLGQPQVFSRAYLSEAYLRVHRFEIQTLCNGKWETAARGDTIGGNLEIKFPPVKAQKVRLNILDAPGGPTIREFMLFAP